MDGRLLLERINHDEGTITLDGVTYPLRDRNFPTIDPENPDVLTAQEQDVMAKLHMSFINSKTAGTCTFSVF